MGDDVVKVLVDVNHGHIDQDLLKSVHGWIVSYLSVPCENFVLGKCLGISLEPAVCAVHCLCLVLFFALSWWIIATPSLPVYRLLEAPLWQ